MKDRSKIIELLVRKKIIEDIKTAKSYVLEGRVKADGKTVNHAGQFIDESAEIEIIKVKDYVSRGGYKLKGAVERFGIAVKGKDAIDIGVSTGGFTDYLLQSGASRVIAIDVAYGMIDWKLRNDKRVYLYERENFRNTDVSKLPFKAEIAVVDVSFISILKIIYKVALSVKQGSDILLLFKPQFESKKEDLEPGAVIRDPVRHIDLLKIFVGRLKDLENLVLEGITYSPIKGSKGNIEFWIYLNKSSKENKTVKKYDKIIRETVMRAHYLLNQ